MKRIEKFINDLNQLKINFFEQRYDDNKREEIDSANKIKLLNMFINYCNEEVIEHPYKKDLSEYTFNEYLKYGIGIG